MAVPGWPAPACCTASMASVRMVSIERCSMSVFAMELLVETLLSFPSRTICLCPLLPRMEHLAERRFAHFAAEAFQRRDRGAAEGCLRHVRDGDRTGEGVGHHLDPPGIGEKRGPGRHHLA